MRKTLLFVFAIASIAIGAGSCKKSSNVVFEHATMKPWFDKYCASCHASGKSNAGDWKYDAADYDGTIKNKISKIYQTVYTNKTMPKGTTLSQTDLDAFKSWYDGGYPAK